jgi:hypothetical protein
MNDCPEIRIFYGWLLRGEADKLSGDYELESDEQFMKWTDNYRAAWRKHEKPIIAALTEALGVSFYKPVIDVACVPSFRPASSPLIIGFRTDSDEFVDVLTHELCHVLLTDNNVVQLNKPKPQMDLSKVWTNLFGTGHSFGTLVHIPVHALCKYIYLDILKQPKRHSRDIAVSKSYKADGQDYVKAWEYVDSHDYKQIIADLKKSYQEAAA